MISVKRCICLFLNIITLGWSDEQHSDTLTCQSVWRSSSGLQEYPRCWHQSCFHPRLRRPLPPDEQRLQQQQRRLQSWREAWHWSGSSQLSLLALSQWTRRRHPRPAASSRRGPDPARPMDLQMWCRPAPTRTGGRSRTEDERREGTACLKHPPSS